MTVDAHPSSRNKTIVNFTVFVTDCVCTIENDWAEKMSRSRMKGGHETVQRKMFVWSY